MEQMKVKVSKYT